MKDDAICLTHTIASTKPPYAANPFISKHLFSGGKIPTASQLTEAIEQMNLVISGWESLIYHYNLTLDQWRKRFLENAGKAKKNMVMNL